MLRPIAEKLRVLKKLTVDAVPYDPSHLSDEVASRTGWGPAHSGGTNFGTHRLVDVGPQRVEFRATRGARIFSGVFVVGGALVLVVVPTEMIGTMGLTWDAGIAIVLPVVMGAASLAVGGAMWSYGAAPVVFDKGRGEYWKGRVAPSEVGNRHALKHWIHLNRIHALQIISERCTSDDSSYYSYELNLVLDDGTRMNVVDHGNRDTLRADAEALSRFLGKPVWDATGAATDAGSVGM